MSDAKEPLSLEAAIIKALNDHGWQLLSWNVNTDGGYDVQQPDKTLNLNVRAVR